MTEIRFYHFSRKTIEQVVPELCDRAFNRGHKILIRLADDVTLNRMNDALWTFKPESFLPHGIPQKQHTDTSFDLQQTPIWLTTESDNPIQADMLILTNGIIANDIQDYKLCCDILDGQNPEQITQGRERWKAYKAAGHTVTYWQQTEEGKWEQKA